MTDLLTGLLLVVGGLFLLVAALGVVRLPDLYLRMSATTKASAFSVSLLLLGVAVYFQDLSVTTRVCATILFFCLTAPVGAHMIGRAAYRDGVPLWKGTQFDELGGGRDVRDRPPDDTAGGERVP